MMASLDFYFPSFFKVLEIFGRGGGWFFLLALVSVHFYTHGREPEGQADVFQIICPINSLEITRSSFAQLFNSPNVDTKGRHEISSRAGLTFSVQELQNGFFKPNTQVLWWEMCTSLGLPVWLLSPRLLSSGFQGQSQTALIARHLWVCVRAMQSPVSSPGHHSCHTHYRHTQQLWGDLEMESSHPISNPLSQMGPFPKWLYKF